MIEINTLEGLELNDIRKLIDTNVDDDGDITIAYPKDGVLYSTSYQELILIYVSAAYVGNVIKQKFDDVITYIPDLQEGNDFEFTFKVDDIDSLTNILLELSFGFGNGDDFDQIEYFSSALGYEEVFVSNPENLIDEKFRHIYEILKELHEDNLDEDI